MKRFVYADNAATTKLDEEALKSMMPYLIEEYGNISQPYSFSRKAKKAITAARIMIAKCINAEPDEIYFTSGGSESDNWAIKGFADCFNKGEIVTSAIEHHAILNTCKKLENLGRKVTYLKPNSEGIIFPEKLADLCESQNGLVSIMTANNEIGTIEPIAELCSYAHQKGYIFHTDAVQAVGHIKLDVKSLKVDMLSASAHKFNGPKGIGFLYIKKGTRICSLIDGGMQETGMRAGTENVAAIIGMAVALQNNCEQIVSIKEYLLSLEDRLICGLKEGNCDFIRNGASNHIPGNISLSFRNEDGERLMHRLDLAGICVSTGAACNSHNTQVSYVLKCINCNKDYEKGTIRISLSKHNSVDDVDYIVEKLKAILGE